MAKAFFIRCCLVLPFIVPLEALPPYLIEKCEMVNNNSSSVFCDATTWGNDEKYLYLDIQNMKDIKDLHLQNFKSVIYNSSFQINQLIISKVDEVTVFLNSVSLKTSSVGGVGSGLLRNYDTDTAGKTGKISLTNIEYLKIGTENVVWKVKSLVFENVQSIDFLTKVTIYADDLSIITSNVLVFDDLMMISDSVHITRESTVEFVSGAGARWNVLTKSFNMFDSTIDMSNGQLYFLNNSSGTFLNNSLYSFNHHSVHINRSADLFIFNNQFSNIDGYFLEEYSDGHIILLSNRFDCNSCLIKDMLLNSSLGDMGEVNYCKADCLLSLKAVTYYMDKSCICSEGGDEADYKRMCLMTDEELQTCGQSHFTIEKVLQWTLFIIIPIILLNVLLFCICHRENRKIVREIAMSKVLPHKLECERLPPDAETKIPQHRNCYNKPQPFDPDNYNAEVAGSYTCR